MSDTAGILRSKMRLPAPGDAPPDRALCRAVVRAADGAGGLTVAISHVEEQDVFPDRLGDHLGEDALILGIEDGATLCGALVIDPGLRDAVIEMATRGDVRSTPPGARAPTRTDAELVRPLAEQVLAERPDIGSGQVWHSGDMIDTARALVLMLPDRQLRLTWMRLAIGEGGRTGALGLVHPVPLAVQPVSRPGAAAEAELLQAAVLAAPARLEAVLHRQELPLSDLRGLRAGQVLRLAGARLDAVQLEAPGGGGPIAGRLGQVAGRRALRIESGAIPDLAGLPVRPGAGGSDQGG